MDKVQQILEKYNTMTLATVGKNGACAAAVFYAFSKEENAMIFLSSPKSEHILNLENNDKCAATIQEDGLDWEIIKGIHIITAIIPNTINSIIYTIVLNPHI